MREKFLGALLLGISACATIGRASTYPMLNTTSTGKWTYSSFSGGQISGLAKPVRLSSTTSENRSVFHSLALKGARIGSTDYSAFTSSSETVTTPDSYTRRFFGRYNINGKTLEGEIRTWADGRFDIRYRWLSSGVGYNEVYVRIDYDLIDAADDIVETVERIDFVEQWHAPTLEYSKGFPFSQRYNPEAIERNAFFRIVDAKPAQEQFYAIFWPNDSESPVNAVFKRYSSDPQTLPPYENSSFQLQEVQTRTEFLPPDNWHSSTAAYAGNDQVVWLTLPNYGNVNAWFGIGGRVFQKPNARPLKLNMAIHSGAPDATADFNLSILSGRSATNALNDLTNSTWSHTKKTVSWQFPEGGAWRDDLHNFMMHARSQSPTTYNAANRDNYRDWFVDVGVLDSYWEGGTSVVGVMFDLWDPNNFFEGNPNLIEREGVAVFWQALEENLVDPLARRKVLMATIVHEVGHAFNLLHNWGNCGDNFGPDDCQNGTIMTYSWLKKDWDTKAWLGTGTMTWDASAPVNTYNQNLDWYKQAPEAWVKPGRYGTFMSMVESLNPPAFIPY